MSEQRTQDPNDTGEQERAKELEKERKDNATRSPASDVAFLAGYLQQLDRGVVTAAERERFAELASRYTEERHKYEGAGDYRDAVPGASTRHPEHADGRARVS